MIFRDKPIHLYLFVFLLSVTIIIWSVLFLEDRRGLLKVFFMDVGQGDAILIDSPSGTQVLIDGGGPNGQVLRALGKVLPFYDRTIDVVLSTHPDQDHIGGLPEVLNRFRVGMIIESEVSSETGVYKAWRENVLKESGVKNVLARHGVRLDLGSGALLEIIFPDRNTSLWETNTASIISIVRYGQNSFLLTGDAPQSVEDYLVTIEGQRLKSDVLKVGHHGSRTSSSEKFIKAVYPAYSIISAGRDNRYGHPHQEVLDRLESFNSKVISTAYAGTIKFTSDGRSVFISASEVSSDGHRSARP